MKSGLRGHPYPEFDLTRPSLTPVTLATLPAKSSGARKRTNFSPKLHQIADNLVNELYGRTRCEKNASVLPQLSFFPLQGELVYANYGRYSDFVALKKAGVEVKGKIVMMRYGPTSRGSKVRNVCAFLSEHRQGWLSGSTREYLG